MSLSKPISNNDVANMALILLKQAPDIKNLDPPTIPVENLVAQIYVSEKQALLRSYPWNFAIKRLIITSDAAIPAFGYKKQFTFPSDFLRYLTRHQSDGRRVIDANENYQIEGNKLLLNDDNTNTAHVRYIFDHQIVSQWDPLFVRLLALNIAITIGPNFVGGKGWVVQLKEERLRVQTEARAIDGQERPPIRRESSAWIKRRRGVGRGRDNSFVDFR